MIIDVHSSSPVDNATDFAPQHNDAGISSAAAQTRALDDDTNEQLKAQTACLLVETKILRAQQNTSTTGYLEQNYKQLDLERIKANHKLFKSYAGLQDYATFQALPRFFGLTVNNLVYHDSGQTMRNFQISNSRREAQKDA